MHVSARGRQNEEGVWLCPRGEGRARSRVQGKGRGAGEGGVKQGRGRGTKGEALRGEERRGGGGQKGEGERGGNPLFLFLVPSPPPSLRSRQKEGRGTVHSCKRDGAKITKGVGVPVVRRVDECWSFRKALELTPSHPTTTTTTGPPTAAIPTASTSNRQHPGIIIEVHRGRRGG